MSAIKGIIIGKSTEALIRLLFDNRAAQESTEGALNAMSRASNIKKLKNEVISFVKRNANSKFELEAPEYDTEKTVKLSFNNFTGEEEEDDVTCEFKMVIDESFTKCNISQKAKFGKDITLRIEV